MISGLTASSPADAHNRLFCLHFSDGSQVHPITETLLHLNLQLQCVRAEDEDILSTQICTNVISMFYPQNYRKLYSMGYKLSFCNLRSNEHEALFVKLLGHKKRGAFKKSHYCVGCVHCTEAVL